MRELTPLPQLYEDSQFSGYDGKDLLNWLRVNYGQYKVDAFNQFMVGQTMALFLDDVSRTHGIVYKWDFERFLDGRPVID